MNKQIDIKSSRSNNSFYYGFIVVIAAFFIMLMIYGIQYAFGIFFEPILSDFGWSRALISGAFSLTWFMTGIMSIVMGGLNDKLGPRVVISITGAIAGTGFILISLVHAPWHLYVFYGVMVGAGISVYVPILSTVTRWFVYRRTTMTGIVVTGIGLGTLIAPVVGNWLIDNYHWRTACVVIGIAVFIVVILAAQFLKRDPAEAGQPLFGESEITAAIASLEARAFSFKEAISTRQFWLAFMMFFAFGYCLLTILVHFPPYSIDHGITAETAALMLGIIGGTSIIGRMAFGRLGDRIGNKNGFIIGFLLMLICLIWLLFAGETWSLFLFASIFGIAYGNIVSQQSPIVATLFGLSSHGLLFGFICLGFNLGATLGPIVTGYLFDIYNNYQIAFSICVIISFTGILLSAMLSPVGRTDDKSIRL